MDNGENVDLQRDINPPGFVVKLGTHVDEIYLLE